jgi:hypothetical protein
MATRISGFCRAVSVFGRVERALDVALRAEVVDLRRIDEAQDAVERRGVGQVPIVEDETPVVLVRALVEIVDAPGC